MKTSKHVKHQARHLFRLCVADGSMKEERVRQVLQGVLTGKRHGYLALANEFERLVKLERLRHTAKVENAEPLPPGLQPNAKGNLVRMYGSELDHSFAKSPAIIDGRIRVGSDVYDGSVRGGLVALEKNF